MITVIGSTSTVVASGQISQNVSETAVQPGQPTSADDTTDTNGNGNAVGDGGSDKIEGLGGGSLWGFATAVVSAAGRDISQFGSILSADAAQLASEVAAATTSALATVQEDLQEIADVLYNEDEDEGNDDDKTKEEEGVGEGGGQDGECVDRLEDDGEKCGSDAGVGGGGGGGGGKSNGTSNANAAEVPASIEVLAHEAAPATPKSIASCLNPPRTSIHLTGSILRPPVAPTATIATTPVAAAGAAEAARVTASSRPPISRLSLSSASHAGAGGYGLGNILELVMPTGADSVAGGFSSGSRGGARTIGVASGRRSLSRSPVGGSDCVGSRSNGRFRVRPSRRGTRSRGRGRDRDGRVAGAASSGNESWLELETDEGASGMSSWGEITAEETDN